MKYLITVLSIFFLMSCGSSEEPVQIKKGRVYHGTVFELESITPVNEVKPAAEVVIEGKVTAVCKKKGCWMKLDKGNGKEIMVTFKDYDFFVPKDVEGQIAILKGNVYTDTTTIEELRHYAEDEGLDAEEIAAIDQEQIDLSIEATGVTFK